MRVTGIPTFNQSPGVIQASTLLYDPQGNCQHHRMKLLRAQLHIRSLLPCSPSFQPTGREHPYNRPQGIPGRRVNTPIVVHRGSVGVIVRNNYVHDFIFAGIRCGSDAHYVGDCMLTQIDRNL
ncbi:unnamed protein product [Closterium sp. NIES-64]|nr:unnamed protein product [Closterium sp. NIES-64]